MSLWKLNLRYCMLHPLHSQFKVYWFWLLVILLTIKVWQFWYISMRVFLLSSAFYACVRQVFQNNLLFKLGCNNLSLLQPIEHKLAWLRFQSNRRDQCCILLTCMFRFKPLLIVDSLTLSFNRGFLWCP